METAVCTKTASTSRSAKMLGGVTDTKKNCPGILDKKEGIKDGGKSWSELVEDEETQKVCLPHYIDLTSRLD